MALTMIGIGFVIATGRSLVFFDLLTRLIPVHDGQLILGAAMGLCGFLILAAPLNMLFPLLSIPFLMFTGGEVYYMIAVGNNGVIAIAAAGLEVITIAEMFKHTAPEATAIERSNFLILAGQPGTRYTANR